MKYAGLAAVSVASLGLVWLAGCGTGQSGGGKGKPKKPPLVKVQPVRKAPVTKTLDVTGEVVATRVVTIRAMVEGPIAFCPWREGDRVEPPAGRLPEPEGAAEAPAARRGLIEIDRPLYREEVRSIQAALDVARAKLADLKAGPRPEEIAQARESIKQLEECTTFTKSDLDRTAKMVRSGSLPAEAMEKTRVAYVKCQTDLASARKRLTMLEAGPTKTEIAVQEALVKEADAKLAVAKAQLAECVIMAPFPAVITKVHVRPGDLATPGAPLVTLLDPSSLVVRFAVPEQAAEAIRRGQSVIVRFDAFAGRAFPGRVVRLYPELDPGSRTRTVEATVEGDSPELMPGLFARVQIVLATVPDALVVPQSAVLVNAKGDRILFVATKGKASLRKVKTGIGQGGFIHIIEGVAAGEQVIVAGNEKLKDGASVRLPGGGTKGGPDQPGKARDKGKGAVR